MRALKQIATWWKAVTRPAELNAEIEDELAFHIDAYAQDLMRSGVPREEAMRRARAEFGGVTAQKENCRAAWGTRVWDELRGDLRYAVRRLRNSKGFAAIAIASLALGMGANTIVFTAAKSLVLDRLGVPRAQELRLFELVQGKRGIVHGSWGYYEETPSGETLMSSFSYPVYQQMRQRNRVLEEVFAFKELGRVTATIDDKAEAVTAEMISGNYYRALEEKPVLGRPAMESDDGAVGSGPVVLISYGFWTRRFGRSPNIVGKKIEVNSAPLTVIGVNPPEFTGAYAAQGSPDIFLPFSMQPIVEPQAGVELLTDRNLFWVMMMGRLKPGVTPQSAQAAMDVELSRAIRATMTVGKDDEIPRLLLVDGSRGQNEVGWEFGKSIYVLTGLAGMVLLLACANLGNLLLARASSRQREMSVRLALGARRARILRQMLTECLLLSAAGGAVGLAVGYVGRNAIPQLLSTSWEPSVAHANFDWTVFGFTAAVSIACGLLFGMVPAWQATRTPVNSGLKDNQHTATQRRRNVAGRTLVVVQVALSMLLLVGAGLFVRTLVNLNDTRLGFESNHLLLFDLAPPRTRYPDAKAVALYRRVEERVRALPSVSGVTPTAVPLISRNSMGQMFDPDDQPREGKEHQHVASNRVGQAFFATFGIPVVAGRGFDEHDTETSAKVAVVNQTLAKKFFPNSDPVGKRVRIGDPEHPVEVQIVGICGDAKYDDLRGDVPATMYVPYRQGEGQEFMSFAVRTGMTPEAIGPSLRAAVASIDKDLPLLDLRTQNEQIEDATKRERVFAGLTSGFGVLALALACIGIYGITAYSVAQRTNEIGLRMALGAQPGGVLRMVVREASWLAIIGVAAGLVAATAMGRLIASMLFGLKSYDPLTLASAAMLLVVVALGSSWIPALRAARIDPMTALRHE
jgi:predicted permease